MPKHPQSSPSKRSNRPPPVLHPAAVRVPSEGFKFTDSHFAALEQAGNVKLSETQRADLLTLAIFWIDDLRLRRSPRPKLFREYLDQIEGAFLQAEQACQWDEGAKYHLMHWAMELKLRVQMGFR